MEPTKLAVVRRRVMEPRTGADQMDRDAQYLMGLLDEALELVHQAQHGGWRDKADRFIRKVQSIPCNRCGDTPCQGCMPCCGSKLGRDPEDGSCRGCG